MHHLKKSASSFKYALEGLQWVFKHHPNFKTHIFAAFTAVLLCIILQIPKIEVALITFCIVLVLTAEMVNTAIEETVNLASPEWHIKAKIAKDVSAGMVLIASLGALIVGSIIFIPHIDTWLCYNLNICFSDPIYYVR